MVEPLSSLRNNNSSFDNNAYLCYSDSLYHKIFQLGLFNQNTILQFDKDPRVSYTWRNSYMKYYFK
jgi:hypothetical protein